MSIKQTIKKYFGHWLYREQCNPDSRTAMENNSPRSVLHLQDASFDIFTDQGEDGIIYYLLKQLREVNPFFIDIGSGNCINSNCASLVVHYGWKGLFIDRNARQLAIGKRFYKERPGVEFSESDVQMENVNELLAGCPSDIGLLSIDIDGNDYWIWKSIDRVRPRIVVIEAKVEFGGRDLVVPYGPANHHSFDKMYNGASVEAFRRLGKEKGYKLVGSNRHGYNLFFVEEKEKITGVSTSEILAQEGIAGSFYPDDFFERAKLFL